MEIVASKTQYTFHAAYILASMIVDKHKGLENDILQIILLLER